MAQSLSSCDIFPFKDVKSSIDPILNYDKGKSDDVLIIDNGKWRKVEEKQQYQQFIQAYNFVPLIISSFSVSIQCRVIQLSDGMG